MIELLTAVAWAFSTVGTGALSMPHYYALATPVEISRSREGGDTNNTVSQSSEANYGLEFKTLTPDKPVVIPKEGETKFKVGIRITNISSTPRKFLPSLGKSFFFDDQQQRVLFDTERKGNGISRLDKNNNWIPYESPCAAGGSGMIQELADVRVLKPGASLELFHDASVYSKAGEVSVFYYSGGYYCNLVGLKSGRYSASMHTYFSIYGADGKSSLVHVKAIPGDVILTAE